MKAVVDNQVCSQHPPDVGGSRFIKVGINTCSHQKIDLNMGGNQFTDRIGQHSGGAEDAKLLFFRIFSLLNATDEEQQSKEQRPHRESKIGRIEELKEHTSIFRDQSLRSRFNHDKK
jgi:hypothetical protein